MIVIELLVSYKTVGGAYLEAGQRYQCYSFNETHIELKCGTTGERVCFARSECRVVESPKSTALRAA